MPEPIAGLHHVTAIIGEPQPNIDFYTGVLAMRMVKLTVNYDDPSVYHLYFGDRTGRPGTAITFFPWPNAKPARPGGGQVLATAYAIPAGSLPYWESRLDEHGVIWQREERMGETLLTLRDPDDLQIELVATDPLPDVQPWDQSDVPLDAAIHGFHSVTLAVAEHGPTCSFLEDVYQFQPGNEEADRRRFTALHGGAGAMVDVQQRPDLRRGEMGPGTVHHVAWRVTDDAAHEAWRQTVMNAGRHVTDVKDRNYFRSIYFREPGGVIFEMATDGPGMTVDESEAQLGTQLQLPPFVEHKREQIVKQLPPLQLPTQS